MLHLAIIFVIFTSGALAINTTNGISAFSLDLYQQCAKSSSGNLIISPFSVANALVLLSQASDGTTYEELKNGLHLSGDKSTVANQFLEQYGQLQRGAGNANLAIANQIYVQQGHEINESFKTMAVQKFLSGIGTVNFADKHVTAETINFFVATKTNNKIKDLIKPDTLNSDARVILINAIYFKAEWQYKFYEDSTNKRDFYTSGTDKVSVDFMNMEEWLNFVVLSDLDAKALELKYADSGFSMVFILPNSRTGLSTLENKLKGYNLTAITANMDSNKIDVSIPKFEVEFEVKLNDALKNLGIGKVFSSDADLSGLLEKGESLQVSDVVHKAFIKVTEGGTEAAGATGIQIIPLSLILNQPVFHADHPFVYYIWDSNSKTPVFIGRVTNLN